MKLKSAAAVILAAASIFSASCVSACAGREATASVPVKLTVVNDYKSISVTVPASLPVEIYNGTVVTADNAKITNNNGKGAVEIKSVAVTDGSFRIGDYDSFSGSRTIALKINGTVTRGSGNMEISKSAFPDIAPSGSLPLSYFAKVSGDTGAMKDKEVAKVIFTISPVE